MCDCYFVVKDRKTGEILCQGSMRDCADFLGCDDAHIQYLVNARRNNITSTRHSKYKVERKMFDGNQSDIERTQYRIPGRKTVDPKIPIIYNPYSKYCKDCVYYMGGFTKFCQYIFVEDKRRPCPPGKDCTVKVKRSKKV